MQEFNIIGFDPASTRNLGWSSFVLSKKPGEDEITKVVSWKSGTFILPTTDEPWQVLWPMFIVVQQFLEFSKPELIIVEKTSSFSGSFITGQVSHCMGVLLAACGKENTPVEFVYPTSVKKTVGGHGRATKSVLKKAVVQYLQKCGITAPKFDSAHAADATANVLYWLIKNKLIDSEDSNGSK